MILLDFVGERGLRIPREGYSEPALWRKLRAAARRAGVGRSLPGGDAGPRSSTTTCPSCAGRALDRPDRLRLPLLPPPLRRPGADLRRAAWTPSGETVLRAAPYTLSGCSSTPEELLLAAPRGYCAGVDRAVQTVERALELYGPPVYVRKEIVHNKHVVEQLRERGAIFVEQETEVPEGETVVFSAHGVAPSVHANAGARGLKTIDATCPLVTKVHVEAKKFAAEGYTIVLIGHAGHEEVEGTMGEAPDAHRPDRDRGGRGPPRGRRPDRVAFISQTTLAVDETRAIILKLRERFPNITGPRTDDICYATTNRQMAVRQMARECDLVLVIGSKQLVELQPPGRGGPRPRRRLLPDRQRVPGAGGVAGGQARGGHLLRRQRPRGARPAPRGVLPRPRHRATSPSSRSSRRTCASCSPRRSARRWRPQAAVGASCPRAQGAWA